SLAVGETTVPISKELLVLSSPFFERLFNADFREKERGVYEIKDISAEDFSWFIKSFHHRIWELTSFESIFKKIHGCSISVIMDSMRCSCCRRAAQSYLPPRCK
ncbi:hypothetical protein PENTCL1PPCAC_29174, partial [Pristionchus entomophagus]